MKKRTSKSFSLENYINHLIFLGAFGSVAVLGTLVKVAYFIDLSSMNL